MCVSSLSLSLILMHIVSTKQRAKAWGDIANILISQEAVIIFSRRLDLDRLYQWLLN